MNAGRADRVPPRRRGGGRGGARDLGRGSLGPTRAIGEKLEDLREHLPFDPLEFLDWEPPYSCERLDAVD